jgi:hypothetical protein
MRIQPVDNTLFHFTKYSETILSNAVDKDRRNEPQATELIKEGGSPSSQLSQPVFE